ncbi:MULTISPECIES: PTS sugar transporter subunit IIB [Lactobacillus]|uniref:PTS system mannose/fructose/N-acetylgalactosamine-transporter subunit IIB n=1 Tax=Lactobacillus TaxID=1578 RepID=UPI0022E1859F|nr:MULTISPECIES: PTS sugar transporter subunit IIB [Lactobacillus]MCO6531779.1 PTS sugar transporter subunit IIB [Lactobacillus sp.]MCO6535242.1 PTS sugar transporter subunit IIB [Lactobacillus sp.]MCT6853930.1 PTS sugar transporter subunit IIB [Lactobacillus panisapium]
MAVEFCRIDDRLIHGQVVTTWLNVKEIEQVIIVDDAVAKDKIQSNVLKMSVPRNVKLHIFSTAKFLKIVPNNPVTRRTMLLFASPFTVEDIVASGYQIPKLNIGGIRGNDERKQYTKAVFLTDKEKQALEKLLSQGVDIEIQMVPSDGAVKLSEVLQK